MGALNKLEGEAKLKSAAMRKFISFLFTAVLFRDLQLVSVNMLIDLRLKLFLLPFIIHYLNLLVDFSKEVLMLRDLQ